MSKIESNSQLIFEIIKFYKWYQMSKIESNSQQVAGSTINIIRYQMSKIESNSHFDGAQCKLKNESSQYCYNFKGR